MTFLSKEDRTERVIEFQDRCLVAGMKELAPYVYELKGPFSKTLTIATLVHGNEIGGIEVLLQILEEIRSQKLSLKSNLRLILGNVDAYFEDKRYLESDMNRAFGSEDRKSKEELRAHELETYLQDTDVLIDIHQTIGATKTPFFIFEYDEESYHLARYLHPTLPVVTNTKKRDFQGKTSTGYTISKGGMAVTLETGQKIIEDTQISLALEISRIAIETDFGDSLPVSPLSHIYTFSQIIHNPDRSLEMVKQFVNFDPIKKDEVLARNSLREVRSEVDGVILFAKYGDYAKTTSELALILGPVHDKKDLKS